MLGKNRLKLHPKNLSAPEPSPRILQSPSEAAPHTQLPDLPHQGSKMTTQSKLKAGKVTDRFCLLVPVYFFTILFIVFTWKIVNTHPLFYLPYYLLFMD